MNWRKAIIQYLKRKKVKERGEKNDRKNTGKHQR